MPLKTVTRTYLEMRHPDELEPSGTAPAGACLELVSPCPAGLYRFLYGEVGKHYHWVDRLPWTDQKLQDYLADDSVSIRILRAGTEIAGFFELVRHADRSVEIAYFGLLQEFLGHGLGKFLLTGAVRIAWGMGASRVWLHTCTLDHPAALPNYLARGFRVVKTETYTADVPA